MAAIMTYYQQQFGRPVPDGLVETECCLGCGRTRAQFDCDCPAGVGYTLTHPDGRRLTSDEELQHYRRQR